MRGRQAEHWSAETLTAALIGLQWLPAPVVVVPLAILRYFHHQCVQWAAALAYYTLIGFVPLLAVLFSIMKGVGLHRELTPFVMSTVSAGSPEVARQIVAFIDRTNVRAVGILSAVAALFAAFGILANAEMCFNAIWGGLPGRSLGRKLRSFTRVAIVAPLLLVLALALTALLQPGSRAYAFFDQLYLGDPVLMALRIMPYALLWSSFTLLYTLLPNATVRKRSALVGAVVAGTLWQFAQWTYVTFVIRLVRYSAVYGALWQLPILLAWIYIAWSIVLYGAEVARAHNEVVAQREQRKQQAPAVVQPAATD
jgi:membrane protein